MLPPDDALVAGLRAGDGDTFARLLDAWSASMVRLARSFVSTVDSAEEVVQDTWLAVIQGIDGFEGRSSLKTWVYRILVNTAKNRGVREHRTVPGRRRRLPRTLAGVPRTLAHPRGRPAGRGDPGGDR